MTQLIYEPSKWNEDIFIRKSHNCYSYALNIIQKRRATKCQKKNNKKKSVCLRKQPNNINKRDESHNCEDLMNNILKEYPEIKKTTKNSRCPEGFYRVALFLLNRKDNHHLTLNDFHFYRQDSNGFWSHKDGWRKATNKDKHGRLIRDPEIVENENESKLCTYFIFPIKK